MFVVAAVPTHYKKAQNSDIVFRERTASVPGLSLVGLSQNWHNCMVEVPVLSVARLLKKCLAASC